MCNQKIANLAQNYLDDVIAIRRHLHENPELSFEEHKTSEFIKSHLDRLGLEYKSYVKTGIVGHIKGGKPGKVVAIRADMDALPITENDSHKCKSKNPGKMHACGHDIHSASLLGVIMILNELKSDIPGTIKFIFQPGEELIPGGASLMIKENALKNPEPDLIIGQHVQPDIPTGMVGFKPGMYMASSDEIYLTIKGKGGHAALPHQVIDPILMASHIVVALQQIVSRNALASIPTVLSFGKIEGGTVNNVIPDEVKLAGTFRTMNEEWRDLAHQKISSIAKGIAQSFGGSCEVEIRRGYPFLVNSETHTKKAAVFAQNCIGSENVIDLDLRMTAEDFAYYSQMYPSVFYRLGVQSPDQTHPASLHSSNFNPDENSLLTGMKIMASLVVEFLNEA